MRLLYKKLFGVKYSYLGLIESLVAEASKYGLALDAGCGPRGLDSATIGIDIDRENAKAYTSRSGRDVVIASLTALPFRDLSVDVAACVYVLEHVEAKKMAVAELCRVGKLVIGCTSNLQNPEMLLDTLLPKSIATALTNKVTVGFLDNDHLERRGLRFNIATLNNALYAANRTWEISVFGTIVFKPKLQLLSIAWTRLYILSMKLKLPTAEGLLFRSRLIQSRDNNKNSR